MSTRTRGAVLVAVACTAVLAACGGNAGERIEREQNGAPPPTVATGKCPIVSSSQLDDIVGIHMTDHYKRTPQGQGPLGDSAVGCDFDSNAGHTAKVLMADGSSSSFDEILAEAGVSTAACPQVSGVGDRAVSCTGGGEAAVLAQSGDRLVMAYRGGEPGGDTLRSQAIEIAKLVLNARG